MLTPKSARPINLVSHSPWSARENPPQNLGYLVNPGKCRRKGQVSQTCIGKLVRTTHSPEVECSQVRRRKNCGDSRAGECNRLVTTGDVLSFALVTSDFPAKSTSVLFWSTQCELCKF